MAVRPSSNRSGALGHDASAEASVERRRTYWKNAGFRPETATQLTESTWQTTM
jgi:hypothetical protein